MERSRRIRSADAGSVDVAQAGGLQRFTHRADVEAQLTAGALALSSMAPAQAAPAAAPQQLLSTQSQSGKAATIAAAAKNQLGVRQDCTALVTKALRAAGIHHHGWPASYLGLGSQVSAAQAQPGDLVYYANGGMGFAHIAVYIGGGKAVHGGWNGNQTVIQTVNVGSGPVYIRVR